MIQTSNDLTAAGLPQPVRGRRVARVQWALEAECAVGVSLLLLAIALRMANIYEARLLPNPGDEGIRGSQLLLMQAGYRPFSEIYASQGPLLLDLLYPLFHLFGGTLPAARLAVAAYSLVGLVGTYWVARQLAGPVGAAAAALFLTLSPTYLQNSRQALAEVVALGPAVLALGAALSYQRSGRGAWLAAAAALLGLSLLIKPIAVAVAPAVVLAVLMTPDRPPLRSLSALAGLAALVVVAGVLAVGLEGVAEQIVAYRLQARGLIGWEPLGNLSSLIAHLQPDQGALFGLAVAGGLVLTRYAPTRGLPLVVWGLASVALLVLYSPLFPKHAVTILPPVAVLAGVALGQLWSLGRTEQGGRRMLHLAFAAGVGFYAWSLPGLVAEVQARLRPLNDSSPGFSGVEDTVGDVAELLEPEAFLLTDHPYVAILAHRLVLPALADPSDTRVRSTGLTSATIEESAGRVATGMVVLRSRRFHNLPGFPAWLHERFQLVKAYAREAENEAPRFTYLPRDFDLERARTSLTAGFSPTPDVEYAGQLRLRAFRVSQPVVERGAVMAVSMDWEAARRFSSSYRVRASLIGPDGLARIDDTLGLGDWSDDNPVWQAGEWVVLVWPVRVPPEAAAGHYQVAVGVYDDRRERDVPYSGRPTERLTADGKQYVLAGVEIR